MMQSDNTINALLDVLEDRYTKKYFIFVSYDLQRISLGRGPRWVHITIHEDGKCTAMGRCLSWEYSELLEAHHPDFMELLDHSVEHLFNTIEYLSRKSKSIADVSTKQARE